MTDRLPPHNLDAERALLGACMASARVVDEVCSAISPGDFYRNAHEQVFAAALAVWESGVEPDPVAVSVELGRRGQLEKVGGAPFLLTLFQEVPTAANAMFYAEQVAEAAVRRRLVVVGQRAEQRAHESAASGVEALEAVRAELDQISDGARAGAGMSEIGVLAVAALERYESPHAAGLETPWHDLNACLNGGLRPGTLTIFGARPGQGKSIAGAGVCLHAALAGECALLVSLEMPETEVADRIVSSMSRVTYSRLRQHNLEDSDRQRIQVAADKLVGIPLRIVDEPYLTLAGIRSLARTVARSDTGLSLLVIDYLQLMTPTDTRVSREQQVAAISRGLKLLAKELDVPVVAAAQLNRGPAARTDKRPTITDLRESGAIEQDADHVVLLHIPEEDERMGEMDMILAKNRGGPTATITVAWAPHYQSIRSLSVEAT